MRHKLTDKYLKNLKPNPDRRFEVRDEFLTGFTVRVTPSGKKTFSLMKRVNGKMLRSKIGDFSLMSLAEARERARQLAYEIETGKFEQATGIRAIQKPTLGEVVSDYIEKHAKVQNRDWRRKHAHLKKFKSLFAHQIDEVSRPDVTAIIDDIAKTAPVGANRALAHFRHMMNWCAGRGLIEVSPITSFKAPTKEKPRERVLSDSELTSLWQACEAEAYPFGDCIKLLILTGQRRSEIAEMRWSEIDFQKKVWTLPSARSKNGRQHTIPLTEHMVSILQSVPRFLNSHYVFTTNGKTPISGFGRFKKRLDAHLPEDTESWIFHDLRRTFSTNLAMLGAPQPVTEALLNHKSGVVSGVAAIYNRYQYADEKRSALELWGRHVTEAFTRQRSIA